MKKKHFLCVCASVQYWRIYTCVDYCKFLFFILVVGKTILCVYVCACLNETRVFYYIFQFFLIFSFLFILVLSNVSVLTQIIRPWTRSHWTEPNVSCVYICVCDWTSFIYTPLKDLHFLFKKSDHDKETYETLLPKYRGIVRRAS